MNKTYPRSLAGLYSISFADHTLKPTLLIDTKLNDYRLEKIEFGANRTGKAIFENGVDFYFPVKWDGITDHYTFVFNEVGHVFSTKNDSGDTLAQTDVMSLRSIDEFGG